MKQNAVVLTLYNAVSPTAREENNEHIIRITELVIELSCGEDLTSAWINYKTTPHGNMGFRITNFVMKCEVCSKNTRTV